MGIAGFFTTMLAAVAVENVVFSRGLGLNKRVFSMERAREAFHYGAIYTWLAVLSGIGSVLIRLLLEKLELSSLFLAPLFLVVVVVVYVGTFYLAQVILKENAKHTQALLPITAFNTALFGVLFITLENSFGIPQTIAYALGSGIGYTIALLLLLVAKRRLAISPIPRNFKGIPILLIYIGIVSLALYGLLGYGLPT